jgi:(hydroxyamino)benzene mutase
METISIAKKQAGQLIFLGVLLFLLGLIVGLVVPVLANPRMGLSSHLEGVMNGMLLIIFGLIWNRLKLSVKWLKITFWMAIYGTFANWFGILIAAFFNAGKMLTVAAKGQEGHPVAEAVVNFCLVTLTLAMLFVSVVVLIGLVRGNRLKNTKS